MWKAPYQFCNGLPSNDDRTLAHIVSGHDGLTFGAGTKPSQRPHVLLRCATVQRAGWSQLSAAAADGQISGSQQLAGGSCMMRAPPSRAALLFHRVSLVQEQLDSLSPELERLLG